MRTLSLIGTILGVCLPAATAANLVVNPGFETGDLTGWTLGACSGGATGVNPHSGSFAYRSASFSGCSLSQSVTTTPGANYTFSFWYANGGPTTPNGFAAQLDGATQMSLTNFGTFAYQQFTVNFVAANASTQIRFLTNHNDQFWYIDDVSFDGGGVPEPGTIGLTVGGLALLAFLRRRA